MRQSPYTSALVVTLVSSIAVTIACATGSTTRTDRETMPILYPRANPLDETSVWDFVSSCRTSSS